MDLSDSAMFANLVYYYDPVFEFMGSIESVLATLVVFLILVLLVLFLYRRYLIIQCNKNEYWLPIVDEAGAVIGRVARSVSFESPGVYQHPLIRILVVKENSVLLGPRTADFCPDKGKHDCPCEYMMEYGVTVDEALDRMQALYFPSSTRPQFLLRYKHENEIGLWQVLLYTLIIQDEKELIGLEKFQGKFWTIPQIRENLGKSFFSHFLEGEIDFLEALQKE